jgi:PHD/YefM family antitoxin component YafN of YafNO toxin-antitoxin module
VRQADREAVVERFSASEVARRMRDVLEAATRAPVLITRHRRARFVLLTVEQFRRLKRERDP